MEALPLMVFMLFFVFKLKKMSKIIGLRLRL